MAFDFSTVVAPFRMQPGLRRLPDGAAQLTPNALGDRALTEKLAVLGGQPLDAFVMEAAFHARPALEALLAHAAAEHPDALLLMPDGAVAAPRLGWTLHGDALEGNGPAEIGACLRALPPAWRLAGLVSLAFANDFAVIDGPTGRIPWLAVCLPSNWAPAEKVGRRLAEIHAPVADSAVLLAASNHLVRLVTGDERWERFVWTCTHSPRLNRHPLHATPTGWDPTLDSQGLAAATYFRTERQTFIPVPSTQQAIFTIHVEVEPLTEAIATRDAAERVHAALASMTADVLAYRGLATARDRLLTWLETRASALA